MDLKSAGLILALITGLIGILGSVGAFVASNESTKDAVSQLKTAEDQLHVTSSKRIDDLQQRFDALSERMNSMDRMMATHEDRLQHSSDDLGRLRDWVKEISRHTSTNGEGK
jgi:predicted  nucleic acid-binding Zn-ribbon protein